MSNYFILEYPVQKGIFFVEKRSYTPKDLMKRHVFGERLAEALPEIVVPFDPQKGALTDLLHDGRFFIVSEKVKELFVTCASTDFEVFPIKIQSKVKVRELYYFICLSATLPVVFDTRCPKANRS